MNPLSEAHYKEIRLQLVKVEEKINAIEREGASNLVVLSNDWIYPTVSRLRFKGSIDELTYYMTIRDALNIGLEKGIVPDKYSYFLIRAPEVIRALLENQESSRLA